MNDNRDRHPLQRPLIVLIVLWWASMWAMDYLPRPTGGWIALFVYAVLFVVSQIWMATNGFQRLPERWRDM